MPLLNYTTSISPSQTVGQVQAILAAHGASAVLCEYDNGDVKALSFRVPTPHGELHFRLPVKDGAVYAVLCRDAKVPRRLQTHEQAVRVAWRILKDWVEAQVAILETEMVTMEQIFLPYLMVDNGHTLYDRMMATGFAQLPQGTERQTTAVVS